MWVLALPTFSAAQNAPQTQIQPTGSRSGLDKLLALHDPALPGEVRTYYTPGFEQRAKNMQAFLAGERDFYRKQLGINIEFSLAVLDRKQWEQLTEDPYGFPYVSDKPYVAVMPASWSDTHLGFFLDQGQANPELVKEVQATGADWMETLYRGADGVGAHEFGHTVIEVYGIDGGTNWLAEFLATYAGYAYIHEQHADLLFPWRTFMSASLDIPRQYTSLDDFEAQLDKLTPANYSWYECMFERQVEKVYAKKGVGFLKEARVAFPASDKPVSMSNAEALRRLEQISPGFTAWAHSLETLPKTQP